MKKKLIVISAAVLCMGLATTAFAANNLRDAGNAAVQPVAPVEVVTPVAAVTPTVPEEPSTPPATATPAAPEVTVPEEIVFGCGMGGLGGLMWDENGNFLDKDVFEKKIDSLIKDGTIAASDKEYFMERYDWCQTNGGGAMGVRGGGGCCGRGMNQSF